METRDASLRAPDVKEIREGSGEGAGGDVFIPSGRTGVRSSTTDVTSIRLNTFLKEPYIRAGAHGESDGAGPLPVPEPWPHFKDNGPVFDVFVEVFAGADAPRRAVPSVNRHRGEQRPVPSQ